MSAIKDFVKKHKIKVGLVSGVIVISSVFGTCSFDPTQKAPAPVEAPVEAAVAPDAGTPDAGGADAAKAPE